MMTPTHGLPLLAREAVAPFAARLGVIARAFEVVSGQPIPIALRQARPRCASHTAAGVYASAMIEHRVEDYHTTGRRSQLNLMLQDVFV